MVALGRLRPRRVKMNEDSALPPPPFGLMDNEIISILDTAIWFLLTRFSTGFSRPVKG